MYLSYNLQKSTISDYIVINILVLFHMRKGSKVFVSMTMFLLLTLPVFAQGGQGTQAQSGSESADEDTVLLRIQEQAQDGEGEGTDDAVMNQEQSEIKKVIINQGEDDQLQVQTENASQEQTRVEMNEEAVLLEMQNQSTGNQLRVKQADGALYLQDGEVEAMTNLSFEVDTETGEIMVTTASGKEVPLSEHPSQMLERLVEEGTLDSATEIELVEDEVESDEVKYVVDGVNDCKLLGLLDVAAPVEVTVDAETGEELSLVQPWYLDWLGFLFTNV